MGTDPRKKLHGPLYTITLLLSGFAAIENGKITLL